MLTSTAVGTVEYRSVCEPIRASNPLAGFLEGSCTAVHPESKSVDVELKSCEANETVKVAYDTLVYACGVGVADFGVPGVLERCHFVKEIADAQKLRRAIAQALETALSPALNSTEARKRCLSFVVVGGGATGVELAAELADFVRDAVARVYPQLKPLAGGRVSETRRSAVQPVASGSKGVCVHTRRSRSVSRCCTRAASCCRSSMLGSAARQKLL